MGALNKIILTFSLLFWAQTVFSQQQKHTMHKDYLLERSAQQKRLGGALLALGLVTIVVGGILQGKAHESVNGL